RLTDHLDEAAHLVPGFREILTVGPADGSEPESEARRRRALTFLLDVTRAAAGAFTAGVATANANVEASRESTTGNDQLETLAHLLHSVAFNLYFVSGAYEKKDGPAPAEQARLLREAGPIIDELAEVGLAPVTHPLL